MRSHYRLPGYHNPKMTSSYAPIDRLRVNETQNRRSHMAAKEQGAVRCIAWLEALGRQYED
ncbi:hypothetical protein [Nostoc sp. DedSLP03]|uniref:hypothetical protein n=1 Tax=Nostoc sp. DedSLP03 TaxID=3075400 RepID=UPI002AD3ED96|nr:hypothetical protein [Nostoc sp. DedSLP03]